MEVKAQSCDLNEIHRVAVNYIVLNLTAIVFSLEVVHVQAIGSENC